jgi:FMN phosphatase YigB (HAD superfamily)
MEKRILNVFDFDGTLMDSPLPEMGKKMYEDKYGKPWPHKGWWGQLDSLECFEVTPIWKVMAIYNRLVKVDGSLNVLMTNRLSKFESVVRKKLNGYYEFDIYNFKSDGRDKPERIEEILLSYPNIREINIFDDMDEQITKFKEFRKKNTEYNIRITQII